MIVEGHGVRDAGGARVLVADGDRAVVELIQTRLDLAGYRVSVVRSGPMALEAIQHVRPAVMIVDLALPELNGFEVLQALKQAEEPHCPILVMGRKLSAEDIRRAIALGARDVIAKPFDGAAILERVARLWRDPAGPASRSSVSAHA